VCGFGSIEFVSIEFGLNRVGGLGVPDSLVWVARSRRFLTPFVSTRGRLVFSGMGLLSAVGRGRFVVGDS
jgi:hypothetical protein